MSKPQEFETEYDYNANQGRGTTAPTQETSTDIIAWLIALIFMGGAIWSIIEIVKIFKS